jgi:ubiquitin-protein ligase
MRADYERVQQLASRSNDRIVLEERRGNPPYRYEIGYRIRSIVALSFGRPKWGDYHRAEIILSSSYPLTEPAANMLTPIFHPHVFSSLKICMGRKWVPTEYLDDFVVRIGQILCFNPEYIDPRSPANHDALAWVNKNRHLIPTDELEIAETPRPSIKWKETSPTVKDWKEQV